MRIFNMTVSWLAILWLFILGPSSALQADAEKSPTKKIVMLDAGHGGHDMGARVSSLQEKKLALLTTLLTKKHLSELGYKVILTRTRDTFVPLPKRVSLAEKVKADLFVSIHYNASKNKEARGMEVYYCPVDTAAKVRASKSLAAKVLSTMVASTDAVSRGIKSAKFHVIRETQMPSILIEAGFITNTEECDLLKDRSYVEKIAQGIASGIDMYFKS